MWSSNAPFSLYRLKAFPAIYTEAFYSLHFAFLPTFLYLLYPFLMFRSDACVVLSFGFKVTDRSISGFLL